MTILCWQWLRQYPTGVGSLLYTRVVWTWHSLMSYPDTKQEVTCKEDHFTREARFAVIHIHSLCPVVAPKLISKVALSAIPPPVIPWTEWFPFLWGKLLSDSDCARSFLSPTHCLCSSLISRPSLKQNTYWVSKQSSRSFPSLPCSNICFTNLRARLA